MNARTNDVCCCYCLDVSLLATVATTVLSRLICLIGCFPLPEITSRSMMMIQSVLSASRDDSPKRIVPNGEKKSHSLFRDNNLSIFVCVFSFFQFRYVNWQSSTHGARLGIYLSVSELLLLGAHMRVDLQMYNFHSEYHWAMSTTMILMVFRWSATMYLHYIILCLYRSTLVQQLYRNDSRFELELTIQHRF